MKTITVENAQNGYILRCGESVFVYEFEVEVLECIRDLLTLGEDIEVKRKE